MFAVERRVTSKVMMAMCLLTQQPLSGALLHPCFLGLIRPRKQCHSIFGWPLLRREHGSQLCGFWGGPPHPWKPSNAGNQFSRLAKRGDRSVSKDGDRALFCAFF